MEEEEVIFEIITKVKCYEYTQEITDYIGSNESLSDLYYNMQEIKEFNVDNSVNLIFTRYPEPENKEIFEEFHLTEENHNDELKNYAKLIEKDGKKTYFVYFEIRTYKKFTLRVFFYGPKADEKYLIDIKDFCKEFLSKYPFKFNEYDEKKLFIL